MIAILTVFSDEEWGPWRRRLTYGAAWVAMLILVIGAAVATTVSVWRFLQPSPFDPLGTYPVQRVLSTVPGVDGPAALLEEGGFVEVEGTKCNASDEPVTVTGRITWISLNPAGLNLVTIDGNRSVREPGCVTRVFRNLIPPEVIEWGPATWHITGFEAPIGPDGKRGVERTIVSENFRLVTP